MRGVRQYGYKMYYEKCYYSTYWYALSYHILSCHVLACIAIYPSTCTAITTHIPLKNLEFMNSFIAMYWIVLACTVMYYHISSCITMYLSTCTAIFDALSLCLSVRVCIFTLTPSNDNKSQYRAIQTNTCNTCIHEF